VLTGPGRDLPALLGHGQEALRTPGAPVTPVQVLAGPGTTTLVETEDQDELLAWEMAAYPAVVPPIEDYLDGPEPEWDPEWVDDLLDDVTLEASTPVCPPGAAAPPVCPPGAAAPPVGRPANPGVPAPPAVEILHVLAAGEGFAHGGTADAMAPGPALAGLADRVWQAGLSGVDDDQLTGVLQAANRLGARAAALKLSAVSALAARRAAGARASGDWRPAEHVNDEIAIALTLTRWSADRVLSLAVALDRLPLTRAALAAGAVDERRAEVIANELTGLDDRHAAAVEELIIGKAAAQTTAQLGAAARRAVFAADPDAVRRRKEKALKDSRVEVFPEAAGTAALAGRDLPPAGVLAADKHLTALALAMKQAGVGGTMDQLRAHAYLHLLTGQSAGTLLPSATWATGEGARGGTPGTPDGGSPATGASGCGASGPGTAGIGRAGPGSSGPGSSGPGTAGTGAAGSGAPGAPGAPGTGALGEAGTGAPGEAAAGTAVPPAGAGLGPGLRGTVNLTVPLATWLGWSQAPGHVPGFGPLDSDDSRAIAAILAANPANRWCITLTDSAGRPVGHGCARAGPGHPARPDQGTRPPGTGPAGSGPAGSGPAANTGWMREVRITPLQTGECTHSRESRSYQPSLSLRHLIEIRNTTCTAPGCRRAATRCDLDHAIPHHLGGRTCECNLGPVCRRHHQCKQVPGWTLTQSSPGTFTWTTPGGRSYTTHPTGYPT